MRSTFLPFAIPDTDDTELQQVAEALQNGWLTTGPKTKQFEQEFASRVGAKYAIALNSCTAALHLALESIGLQAGDEVITSLHLRCYCGSNSLLRCQACICRYQCGLFKYAPRSD
jgi:dTDP-4-amino-4,6-dideoxygalactose transaminase